MVAELGWQTLNLMQIFDVLRSTDVCRLCVDDDGQPWCVPMHFQFETSGQDIIIHLVMPAKGRKLEAVGGNDRVCLEFEQPGCAWTDVVIITGRAGMGLYVPGKAIHLRIRAREVSGRRYFLLEGGS